MLQGGSVMGLGEALFQRVIFGSDWPNSEHVGQYSEVMTVAQAYVNGKGSAAVEKVFWRNSVAAYRWVKRAPTQPQA